MTAHQVDHVLVGAGLILVGWWARGRRRLACASALVAAWRLHACHRHHHRDPLDSTWRSAVLHMAADHRRRA